MADLLSFIRKLPRDSALAREEAGEWGDWDAHKENTARLLEIESYKLELAWIDRITDPDDREVRRERLEAERAGIKPPPHPMVPPIAMRPAGIGEERLQEYLDAVSAFGPPPREPRLVDMDEFDRVMGLVTE